MEKVVFYKSKWFVNLFFAIFTVLFFVSFVWTIFVHQNDFNIPLLGRKFADARINFEMDESLLKNVHLMSGKIELDPYIMQTKNSYITYETNKIPIYNLSIKIDGNNPEKYIKQIDNIAISLGKSFYYFTSDDILNFKKDKEGKFLFPKNVKYYKNGKYITDKGAMKQIAVSSLAVFYNMKYFIFPLITLFFAVLIYMNNKEKINLGFNIFKNYAIWWIILFGIILRIADNGFAFWSDELYTATVAGNPNAPFSAVLTDPGNPPLFFILARYWQMIFGQNEALLRLLPCLFSVLTIYAIYYFVKKYSSKNAALLASFLFTISFYSIQSAQEFRTYSLAAMFSVVSGILMFKIIEENKNKDFILYGILAILMANCHYFQILVLVGNFFFACFKMKKDQIIKFFFANLFGAILFLPYFLTTSLNRALLDTSFNGTIGGINLVGLFDVISKLFTNSITPVLIFLVTILILIPKVKNLIFDEINKKTLNFYFYSLFITFFVFISAFLISQLRPIIKSFYFINVLPYAVILISLIIFLPFKKTFVRFLFSMFFLLTYFLGTNFFEKNGLMLIRFGDVFQYAHYDSVKYREKGLKIGIALHDTKDYGLFYKKYLKGDEEYVMYPFTPLTDRARDFIDSLNNSLADVIYIRLRFNTFSLFVQMYSPYADISMIRVDKDVLIARIVKKGQK